jgi:RND family efflux transporter MFP subunit
MRVLPIPLPMSLLMPLLMLALPAHAWEAKPLREIAVYPERSAQAQVVSLNESRIAAELTARIVKLAVEPGQRIARGALIAQLDCRDYGLATERAEAAKAASQARARLADLQYVRARKLTTEGFISREALDSRAAELDSARADVAVNAAAVKTTRSAQSKCRVRAPFPAIVLERLAQEGEMATPGTALASLIDTSRIEVKAEVQAADAVSLKTAGNIVLVTGEGRFGVRLARLSPALVKNSRLAEARLRFTGKAAAPGASGRIVWASPEMHVAAALLARRQGKLGVFVASDKTTRFHPLPNAQEGRPAKAEGLQADSRIVVRGQGTL